MSDYADNFTGRHRTRYRGNGRVHTMKLRLQNDVNPNSPAVATMVGGFLSTMLTNMYNDFAIISADYANKDSDVYLPVATLPALSGSPSAGAADPIYSAQYANFIGRSVGGETAKFFLYGLKLGVGALTTDWKLTGAEVATLTAAIGTLNAASAILAGPDGNEVAWYPYVNTKFSDHWVKQARKGA